MSTNNDLEKLREESALAVEAAAEQRRAQREQEIRSLAVQPNLYCSICSGELAEGEPVWAGFIGSMSTAIAVCSKPNCSIHTLPKHGGDGMTGVFRGGQIVFTGDMPDA